MNLGQLSNLIANTITHEIGHTLGLDHLLLPTDVMHNGINHRIHSLMPICAWVLDAEYLLRSCESLINCCGSMIPQL
ncbi:MAG: hypothetical protein NWQ43_11025 [Dolichospermum sp.]|nr:hypothetical protein [Dolichospermum sp.]